jgi:hypothetical protein
MSDHEFLAYLFYRAIYPHTSALLILILGVVNPVFTFRSLFADVFGMVTCRV